MLAEAAESVATPQIRNVGTLAGNVCQRPWCWYFRNGFPCFKNGGNHCFSIAGENQFHAIFGGGPSYIVHPSDTAPALVALDATFRIVGPGGRADGAGGRVLRAADGRTRRARTCSATTRCWRRSQLPAARRGTRSTYHKVLDREAWTHAVVSAAVVLEMDGEVCRSARVVLGGVAPIPWRLPEVEKLLAGQRITAELAAQAGEAAVAGARPLAKNAYKVPLTKSDGEADAGIGRERFARLKGSCVRILSTLLFLSLAVAIAAQPAPSSRAPRNAAEFDELFQQVKNWGRWGTDDQLGSVNLITAAKRKQALALVEERRQPCRSRTTRSPNAPRTTPARSSTR